MQRLNTEMLLTASLKLINKRVDSQFFVQFTAFFELVCHETRVKKQTRSVSKFIYHANNNFIATHDVSIKVSSFLLCLENSLALPLFLLVHLFDKHFACCA